MTIDKKSVSVVGSGSGGPTNVTKTNKLSTTAMAASSANHVAPSAVAAKNAPPAPPQAPQAQLIFHAGKLEALQVDVAILQALLRRNRCNHGRTKYYQRLSMAISAIKRYQALDLYTNFMALKRDVLATAQRKEVQRQRQLVFWEIQTTTANNSKSNDTDMQHQRQRLLALRETLLALPSILQRLEFAAAALWVEMARGFFLPFCVTAVAAVARVKWLLRQAGLWILMPSSSAVKDSSSLSSIDEQQDEWSILERVWQLAHHPHPQGAATGADHVETTRLVVWPQSQRNELRAVLLDSTNSQPSQADTTEAALSSSMSSWSNTRIMASVADNSAKLAINNGNSAATSDCMDDTNTSFNDTTDNDNAPGESAVKVAGQHDGDDVVGVDQNDDDEDDTGVAVGGLAFMTRAANGEDLMEQRGAEEEEDDDDDVDDSGINAHHHHHHHHNQEFDQNMDRVQEFKRNRCTNKKKKKQKGCAEDINSTINNVALQKKQRKRAAAGAAAATSCSDPESIDDKTSRKKKKKKESSKQNKKKKGGFFDELFG